MTIPNLVHQSFQPFPNLDAPIANNDLTVSIPWYQLFITLWNRSGGSAGGGFITPTTPGGKGQPQALSTSPFTLLTSTTGVLLITRKYTVVPGTGVRTREAGGETVEYSRDGGTTYYLAGSAPLALFITAQDQTRVSWFTSNPPIVVFFPIAGA